MAEASASSATGHTHNDYLITIKHPEDDQEDSVLTFDLSIGFDGAHYRPCTISRYIVPKDGVFHGRLDTSDQATPKVWAKCSSQPSLEAPLRVLDRATIRFTLKDPREVHQLTDIPLPLQTSEKIEVTALCLPIEGFSTASGRSFKITCTKLGNGENSKCKFDNDIKRKGGGWREKFRSRTRSRD